MARYVGALDQGTTAFALGRCGPKGLRGPGLERCSFRLEDLVPGATFPIAEVEFGETGIDDDFELRTRGDGHGEGVCARARRTVESLDRIRHLP